MYRIAPELIDDISGIDCLLLRKTDPSLLWL